MRQPPGLSPDDSLSRVAFFFRETPFRILPVTQEGKLIGVVTEQSLAHALASGASSLEPVTAAMREQPGRIGPETTGAQALRALEDGNEPGLVVVDAEGYPLGVVTPTDLLAPDTVGVRPHLVGGMATPFGVYLTTGSVRAGAGDLALAATGALLFLLFAASVVASELIAGLLTAEAWNGRIVAWTRDFAPVALFLFAVRALPLSGIHAAEHKVVHAIERGEPLEPEVVRRMPRIHPRCGTNLAAGLALFVGLAETPWTRDPQLRMIVAALATLFFWRPIGNFLQWAVTTRPPTEKHIRLGVRAGKELLEKYRRARGRPLGVLRRIAASGLLHVLAGSFACGAALQGIAGLFGVRLLL